MARRLAPLLAHYGTRIASRSNVFVSNPLCNVRSLRSALHISSDATQVFGRTHRQPYHSPRGFASVSTPPIEGEKDSYSKSGAENETDERKGASGDVDGASGETNGAGGEDSALDFSSTMEEPSAARPYASYTQTHKRKIWMKDDTKVKRFGYNVVKGGGVLMALGGAATLANNHLWGYLTTDVMCVASVVVGSLGFLIARHAQTSARKGKDEKPKMTLPRRFEFVLLNDDARFYSETKGLDEMFGEHEWPRPLQQKMSLEARNESISKIKANWNEKQLVMQFVEKSLQEGQTTEELKAMLNRRVFVIDFSDIGRTNQAQLSTRARVAQLGEMVSLVLSVASKFDQVVVKVTSPGGSVIDYGLAGSHLMRLKAARLHTTVCVDTVAASGGYLMAAVADKIVAAPFAFLGSIGVVSQMINIHKVLKKNDVDTMLFTAGKYKRTVTPFTETTQEAIDKVNQDIDEIHQAFKEHVTMNRELLNGSIDEVATGEVWLGVQAKNKGLVDELMTSEQYLRAQMVVADVIAVRPFHKKRTINDLLERVATNASAAIAYVSGGWLQQATGLGYTKSDFLQGGVPGLDAFGAQNAVHNPSRDIHFK